MNKLLLLAFAWSSSAAAATHPSVEVEIDPCLPASDEIRRVAQIELGDLFVTDVSSAHTHARAECAGAFISLRVDDPITGRSLSRSLDLSAVMTASRPRLIALALVELVASSWTELEPIAPPSLAAPREAFAPSEPSLSRVRITAEAGGIRFSDIHVLEGGGLRIADGRQSRLGWMLDGHVSRGQQAVDLGTVKTELLDVGIAVQTHASLALTRLDAGAGLRGGGVRMQGMTTDSNLESGAFWARWLGVFVSGHAGVPLFERITLDATVEAGYVLEPVAGLIDGRRSIAVDGAWLAGRVGIGVAL